MQAQRDSEWRDFLAGKGANASSGVATVDAKDKDRSRVAAKVGGKFYLVSLSVVFLRLLSKGR